MGKYADHLLLYRREAIFGRAGMAISRSTLKTAVLSHRVLHADETPAEMLKPGEGKTQRACLWAYAPGARESIKAVFYDSCESCTGEHARRCLGCGADKAWKGSLTCDDFSGYKALIASGVAEVGCNCQWTTISIVHDNWLFAGSLRACQRAAAVMNLI